MEKEKIEAHAHAIMNADTEYDAQQMLEKIENRRIKRSMIQGRKLNLKDTEYNRDLDEIIKLISHK